MVASASGGPSTASKSAQAVVDARERIEVPSWVFVKAGEDDKEEAKDELETMHFGGVAGRGSASPVKRLRHATAEAVRQSHIQPTSTTSPRSAVLNRALIM
jgi:hypothetical protein